MQILLWSPFEKKMRCRVVDEEYPLSYLAHAKALGLAWKLEPSERDSDLKIGLWRNAERVIAHALSHEENKSAYLDFIYSVGAFCTNLYFDGCLGKPYVTDFVYLVEFEFLTQQKASLSFVNRLLPYEIKDKLLKGKCFFANTFRDQTVSITMN